MIDYGTRQTDLAVKRAEWRLSRVYHQAEKDIDEKLKAREKGHQRREAMYRQQLADGKITQADFDAWMRGQVFQGKQWQARKEQIQQTLLQADTAAASIINEGKLGVFATNANYIGYGLEHDANINTGFTLYDEQTVARLVKSDPKLLPPAKVKKDKAFTYYNKLVNSSITLGIIEGEDIRQIAKRIAKTTGERSYSSAVRNARTAYTGAQNAGRIEGLHQAQKLGIKVQKKWMATLDSRTRDAHADLDGQVQEVDDPFESDLGKIMFPGDPTADPANTYNCRCTLVYVYPDYPSDMQRRDNETGEIIDNMTYREWEEMKRGDGEQPESETKELNAPWKPENEAQEEEQKAKADYFRDLGAEVDNNGNVVLYHATTEAAVRQIEKEGFRPNEDPINGIQIEEVKPRSFFGYDRQWIEDTWATKDSKIMKIRVPAYFLHQAGQNTDEVFIEGWIHKKGKVWLPDEDPTSLAWDRRLVKRWKKRNS
jgi:SPP1 gp7 family putative phage head morphogenesis protein